jgi:adenylate kinase
LALDIVILGPPGAGKGTQAKLISADAGVPHIATGDMLRAAIAEGTPLGREVERWVAAGRLVSDDLMIRLVRERLLADDTAEGFVLDGFPRTLPQAEALDVMLDEIDREPLSLVLDFELPEEVAVERLLGRARSDDTPELIRVRLREQRVPDELVAYYRTRGLLVAIQADRTPGEVFAQIQDVLQSAAARQ